MTNQMVNKIGHMVDLKTKDRLLQVAQNEFAHKGFAGARMNVIAQKSKTNKAMIYYYFGSKEKLYMTILRNILQNSLACPWQEVDQFKKVSERLYASIYLLIQFHLGRSDKIANRIMAWEIAEGGEHFKILVEEILVPQVSQTVEAILKEGIEQKVFEIDDIYLFVLNLFIIIPNFAHKKDLLEQNYFGKKVFTKNYKINFANFIMNTFFKSILKNTSKDMPSKIPNQISKHLDAMIKEINLKEKSIT